MIASREDSLRKTLLRKLDNVKADNLLMVELIVAVHGLTSAVEQLDLEPGIDTSDIEAKLSDIADKVDTVGDKLENIDTTLTDLQRDSTSSA